MIQLIYTTLLAFILCLVIGPLFIPLLRRLKFGQTIRDDGPKQHLSKAGTPTMGGIIILLALTVASLFFAGAEPHLLAVLFVTLGYGLVGFLDDLLKIIKRRSLGLRAREKLFAQIVLALIFAYVTIVYFDRGTDVVIPFVNYHFTLGWFYFPFVILVLLGASNAVNLTDGLDGLAAGTTLIAAIFYTLIALVLDQSGVAIFCAALAGACLGFLKFNYHPAQVFMGDTGSLALGGALGTVAILTKTEFLLVIIGGIFVIETLSVIMQVISFRLTGRRIFRMSPLHHHFELMGWPEVQVVMRFWIIAVILGLVGLVGLQGMG